MEVHLRNSFLRVPATVFQSCPQLCYITVFITLMIIRFWTDRSGQTVQTQIRLLLEEQSDQGLHCLPFCLHRLDALHCDSTSLYEF